ncbi:hypothetical protein QFC20_003183 [Naganishia adeliensis]|uniref:Uncharacterized protein n=1 Tax=Naganishia adeliensis TaxID=92952 RepID=A0ACC2WF00_9TREE|nr:hypothetical protein QFC20_003183 [Naganishia adeliensis]
MTPMQVPADLVSKVAPPSTPGINNDGSSFEDGKDANSSKANSHLDHPSDVALTGVQTARSTLSDVGRGTDPEVSGMAEALNPPQASDLRRRSKNLPDLLAGIDSTQVVDLFFPSKGKAPGIHEDALRMNVYWRMGLLGRERKDFCFMFWDEDHPKCRKLIVEAFDELYDKVHKRA